MKLIYAGSLSAFVLAGVGTAPMVSLFAPSEAFATNYTCQADLVVRGGQVITSSLGDGFSQRQACQNALSQCQSDLDTLQQQGQYRYAACRINNGHGNGPVTPVPGPGPFPPNPGNYFEISCSSFDHNVNYCHVGAYAYDVSLVSQFSSASCRKNRTFGLQGEYLWVTEGCRGAFGIFTR